MNNLPTPPPFPRALPLTVILPATAVLALLTDLLLWEASPGAGWILLFPLWWLGGICCWGRFRLGSKTGLLSVAGLAAVAQGVWETGFSNFMVLILVSLMLLGATVYAGLPSAWGRFSEAVWNLVRAPFRWAAAGFLLASGSSQWGGVMGRTGRLLAVAFPAVVLGGVFLLLMAGGNAVLAHGLDEVWAGLLEWLRRLEISLPRVLFWGAAATLGLAWVWPYAVPASRRWWDRPSGPRAGGPAPYLLPAGIAVLATVNGIFLLANSIDTVFLWWGGSLPPGVRPSAYLHEGVAFLIAAVLLSALVLVAVCEPSNTVARNRWVRILALAWIGQNLIVLGSVVFRLHLYVEAFQWSTQRVGVGCFVILVGAGFVLMACYVAGGKTLGWLLWSNARAVLVFFFLVQFLDIRGAVAAWNVAQWRSQPERNLDVDYLASLGPSAWPSLHRVLEFGNEGPAARSAARHLAVKRGEAASYLQAVDRDPRGWQGKKSLHARWLLERKFTVEPWP